MKLITMNIRSRIHEVCYEAIMKPITNKVVEEPEDEDTPNEEDEDQKE